MGAISLVKEYDTNGGRLMSNIAINVIQSPILINPLCLFDLFIINRQNIPLRKSC